MGARNLAQAADEQPRTLPPSMVERMTLILEAFDSPTRRLTLEQVSQRTTLPRSTAHRILDQLVRLDWLEHAPGGYALGSRALGLGGSSGAGHGDLRAAAGGVLHELQVRTGLVVHLAVLDGAKISYLDKVGGRFAAEVPSRVGGRAPAHRTALGKAMLAWLPAEEVDVRIGPVIQAMPAHPMESLQLLHADLARTRARHGLAMERGECFSQLSCVASAVRGSVVPAAISLVGGINVPLEKVAPLVVDAARRVSADLAL